MKVLWSDNNTSRCGRSNAPWQAFGVSIDTRRLCRGDLFVALPGQSDDGHQFVNRAMDKGASAAMVSRFVESPLPQIRVKDGLDGLHCLARLARRRSHACHIAVTGSSGKTGTKDMIARLCMAGNDIDAGDVFASKGNFNNHIGLPLCLASIPPDCRFGVFEMGMNHAGEITDLSRLLRPDVCVVTNIGPAHIGHFNHLADIAAAKAEIFSHASAKSAILPRESPFFTMLSEKAAENGIKDIISFGFHPDADWHIRQIHSDGGHSGEGDSDGPHLDGDAIRAVIRRGAKDFAVAIRHGARHHLLNAAAALAAVSAAGGRIDDVSGALHDLPLAKGRGLSRDIILKGGKARVLDESYNANPDSMRRAIQVMADAKPCGRKIAVLGDMMELGHYARSFHLGLCHPLREAGIARVFTTGKWMRHLHDALPLPMRGRHDDDIAELCRRVMADLRPGDVVMVKGSAASRVSEIVDYLCRSTAKGGGDAV